MLSIQLTVAVRRFIVGQSCTLLYRRVELCEALRVSRAWDRSKILPNRIRRYSRLKICATSVSCASRVKPKEASDQECRDGRGGAGRRRSCLGHARPLPEESQCGNRHMQQEE